MALGRTAKRWLLLLVGLPIVAVTLVVVADLIPDRYVTDRLVDAIAAGELDARPYTVGASGAQVDKFSECKRLTVGLGAPPGMGTVESAISSPTLGPCPTAIPKLLGWSNGEGLERSYDYFRYWNGSTVVLRPAVAAVGVTGTRVLAAAALALVIWAWASRVGRMIGRIAPTLFVAVLVLTTDAIDLPGALVHAIGMVVTFGAAAAVVWWLSADASPGTYAAAAFGAGAASQFFGDLTNPDASWAILIMSAAIVASVLPIRSAAARVAAAGVAWIAGYAWIWVSKWVVAAVVLGYDAVRSDVVDKAEERLGGDAEGYDDGLAAGLSGAWRVWIDQPLMPWALVGLVVVAIIVVIRRREAVSTWPYRLMLGSAAIIPPVWHLVLRNHTTVHSFFTYRSFAVAFGIILVAATARLASQPRGDELLDRTPGQNLVAEANRG